MKLTKDECRILSAALNDFKYDLDLSKNIDNLFNNLEQLQAALLEAGKDNRRLGRTSMNDWSDLLKRYSKSVPRTSKTFPS